MAESSAAMTLTRFQSRAEPAEGADPGGEAPRLHVVTFGCQMNKYDSQLVEGRFRKRGYATTGDIGEADVILFNTCSVRDHAEERVWSWLGELKRARESRPDLVLGVMGCMAQRVEEEVFRRAGHVDVVCGTRQLQDLPDLVDEVRRRRAEPDGGRDARVLATALDSEFVVDRAGEPYTGGLHGYLAVMRGCNLNCTFCVVPRTRGRVISHPIPALVDEARWMVDQGCRVITLLGQTVNSYGEELDPPGPGEPRGRGRQGRPGLADLLHALQEVPDLARIRLVTLHPSYATRALAEAVRDCDKVDRFLPLPAQHGSDRVLRAMKRGYTTDLYRRRADVLRELVPDIELGSDWIVGFPTETDEEFATCEDFVAEQGFVVNYVFKYSPRPDTAAFDRADDVSEDVKKERNQRLLAAAERVQRRRFEAQLGRRQPAFVEEASADRPGTLRARTHHNLPISLQGAPGLVGTTVEVVPRHASPYGLAGVLAEDA